jgi:hypothetical protein
VDQPTYNFMLFLAEQAEYMWYTQYC